MHKNRKALINNLFPNILNRSVTFATHRQGSRACFHPNPFTGMITEMERVWMDTTQIAQIRP